MTVHGLGRRVEEGGGWRREEGGEWRKVDVGRVGGGGSILAKELMLSNLYSVYTAVCVDVRACGCVDAK